MGHIAWSTGPLFLSDVMAVPVSGVQTKVICGDSATLNRKIMFTPLVLEYGQALHMSITDSG